MTGKQWILTGAGIFLAIVVFIGIKFFSEESQNSFNRSIQNTMGLKQGTVEVYVGQPSPVRQFFHVEKVSTVFESDGDLIKSYGYGYIDQNKNGKLDPEEKKVGKKYFEVPSFSQYIYFDGSN